MWRTAQFTLKTTLSFAMKSNVLYKTTYRRCLWFVISQPLEHPWGPGRLTWEGNGHPFENKTYFSGPLIRLVISHQSKESQECFILSKWFDSVQSEFILVILVNSPGQCCPVIHVQFLSAGGRKESNLPNSQKQDKNWFKTKFNSSTHPL